MSKTNNEKYVDGFVFLVPKNKVAAYKKMARDGAATWKKFGALDYKECKGDDLATKGPDGMPAPMNFTKLTAAGTEDTIWFSFITFKNKTHRNQVNKKVMAYFAKKYSNQTNQEMPFDMAKMAYGGFTVQVD